MISLENCGNNTGSSNTGSVGIIGLGTWGTALAQHLARKGHAVCGWAREHEIVAGINNNHRNPLYLPQFEILSGIRATADIGEVCSANFLVVALPSAALEEMGSMLAPIVKGKVIISVIKGLEKKTLLTPVSYLERSLGQDNKIAVLSGPSFALDVISERPCGVVAAAHQEDIARKVANVFTAETMKVYLSTDTLGVELGGALKNVIALAAGVSDGLGLGDSARAGLITRGLAEIMRLAAAMGADPRTLSGLSGLGDLAMTASSNVSRNHTVGFRLGRGESLEQILATLGSVAEGVETTPQALALAKRHQVEMPICEHVATLLRGEMSAAALAKSLATRPIRREGN